MVIKRRAASKDFWNTPSKRITRSVRMEKEYRQLRANDLSDYTHGTHLLRAKACNASFASGRITIVGRTFFNRAMASSTVAASSLARRNAPAIAALRE